MLILLGLLQVADPMLAVRLFASVPTALLPFPFFFLVVRYASRPVALIATVVFSFAEGFSEMTGWGGAPEFLAMAPMLGAFLFLLRYMEPRRRNDLVVAAVLASLVVGIHLLSAAILALSAGAWALLEVSRNRSTSAAVPCLIFGGLSGVLSLLYVPSTSTSSTVSLRRSRFSPSIRW